MSLPSFLCHSPVQCTAGPAALRGKKDTKFLEICTEAGLVDQRMFDQQHVAVSTSKICDLTREVRPVTKPLNRSSTHKTNWQSKQNILKQKNYDEHSSKKAPFCFALLCILRLEFDNYITVRNFSQYSTDQKLTWALYFTSKVEKKLA